MEMATATANPAHFCVRKFPLSGNLCGGSVSALLFSPVSSSKSPAFNRSGIFVTRASVAVEETTQTKAAVIRIGTRGR